MARRLSQLAGRVHRRHQRRPGPARRVHQLPVELRAPGRVRTRPRPPGRAAGARGAARRVRKVPAAAGLLGPRPQDEEVWNPAGAASSSAAAALPSAAGHRPAGRPAGAAQAGHPRGADAAVPGEAVRDCAPHRRPDRHRRHLRPLRHDDLRPPGERGAAGACGFPGHDRKRHSHIHDCNTPHRPPRRRLQELRRGGGPLFIRSSPPDHCANHSPKSTLEVGRKVDFGSRLWKSTLEVDFGRLWKSTLEVDFGSRLWKSN